MEIFSNRTNWPALRIAILIFITAGAFMPNAANSQTITLNPGDDIQAAVDVAVNGTTIELNAGTYAITQQIVIPHGKDLTIKGVGGQAIIQQTGTNQRVISVGTTPGGLGSHLTLVHITVTGGNISGSGGGIMVYRHSGLTLIDGTVSGNTATGTGGGIHIGDGITGTGKLWLVNSDLIGNTSNGHGGGAYLGLTSQFLMYGGVVRVTSLSSEWTNHSNFLNPAAPQTVTSGITLFPVLTGRTYNLLYQVPANPALLNKPDGVYTTQLGYEFSGLLGNTASVTLNVHIQNVLGITAGGNPSFTIDQEEEFANGIILNQTGGLTVNASQDYDIHVSASGPFSSGTQTIPVNHLRVAVLNAGGTITEAVPLSASGSQLVNGGAAALQKGLNLRYELEGGPHLLNLPTGSYSTNLLYTISAD